MEISLFTNTKQTLNLFYDECKYNIFKNKQFLKDCLLKLLLFHSFWTYISSIYLIKDFMVNLNNYIYLSLYWLILGILSSIGLGSGINTGVFFLFPFITKITLNAIYCGHTDFEIYGEDVFKCEVENKEPSVFLIFLKVIHCVFFWGVGTALGEIPPFYIARNTRLSGKKIDLSYVNQNQFMKYANEKMLVFIKSYGFYTILFFASWPNMLFDVCGIACGYCLITFRDFITATILGKAFIKSPLQALFLIYMIIQTLNNESLSFLPDFIRKYIKTLTENERKKDSNESYFHINKDNNISSLNNIDNLINNNENQGLSIYHLFFYLWNGFVIYLFLYFIKNIVETIAHKRHKRINNIKED